MERSGDKSVVQYIPVEVGIFNISIMWNGQHIPGKKIKALVPDAWFNLSFAQSDYSSFMYLRYTSWGEGFLQYHTPIFII